MSSKAVKTNVTDNENACVVCFKTVQIYSVGDCDHPVCYECSTRMRVLCKQNECPICRQDMTKVIFTRNVLPFKSLQNSTNLFDRKYRIAFMESDIQASYNELLEHNCFKCKKENKVANFRTFALLKDHMRREHELHYCDLCVENLKIFSYERRSYTRSELAQHRRKGDSDDKSHKGHPLCEFCDQRYMDSDELFRHLRRDHLYCHFCDADGFHHYYSSYEFLREHFRNEHYLCEEGDCSDIEFTSVFRTEIDLKAHRASAHIRTMGKVAAKQARTLELEFTLAPRSRMENNARTPQRKFQNGRSSAQDDRSEGATGYDSGQNDPGPSTDYAEHINNSVKLRVDPLNSEDFPSLISGNGTSSLNRHNVPTRNVRSSSGAQARSKEDFPALGPPSSSSEPVSNSAQFRLSVQGGPSSAIIRNSNNKPNVSIHVSNRSNGAVTIPNKVKSASREDDFPQLQPVNYKMLGVSQKHRSLVSDSYNSVSSSVASSKVSLVKKEQQQRLSQDDSTKKVSINSVGDFPSLGNNYSEPQQSNPQWLSNKPKKQSKVAPAPVLPKSQCLTDASAFPTLSRSDQKSQGNYMSSSQSSTNELKNSKNKKKKAMPNDSSRKENIDRSKSEAPAYETVKSKKDKKKETKRSELTIDSINSNQNIANNFRNNSDSISRSTDSISAPPGFKAAQGPSLASRINPPPGFSSQEANNLTFISSSGQAYNILPGSYTYAQPKGFSHRNKILVERFQDTLCSSLAMADFLEVSKLFREGILSAQSFYDHCIKALGKDFDEIFPELLALLPDICKQQELYYIFIQSEKSNDKIEMCATCHQVLLRADLKHHVLTHSFENHFPVLGNEVPLSNVWKK